MVALVALLSGLSSCSTVNRAAQMASQVGSATAGTSGGLDAGVLRTALSALLSGINELLQPQREFWLSLAAVIDDLALTDQAANQGIPAAVVLICRMPGPVELLETEPEEPRGEDVEAPWVLAGQLGELGLPLRLEIEVGLEASVVTLRGGGWLLCGLTEAHLEVDGYPLELGDAEQIEPELLLRVWPEDFEESGEPPRAIEVSFRMRLSNEVLIAAFEAERFTLWLGDAPIDLYPEDAEVSAPILAALRGPEVEEEAVEPGPEALEPVSEEPEPVPEEPEYDAEAPEYDAGDPAPDEVELLEVP
jgi:hypothetical protein